MPAASRASGTQRSRFSLTAAPKMGPGEGHVAATESFSVRTKRRVLRGSPGRMLSARSPYDARMSATASIPCLVGSTGTGKSDVAVAAIRALGQSGEVISCDAYAVYRGIPILTAAPSPPSDVPHHLVGILQPYDTYDAARFLTDADYHIAEARRRTHTPWIVGGTALYLRCWLKGFGPKAPSDPTYRESLKALVKRDGPQALHAMLVAADPERASELHPNDVLRVGRALEIIQATGQLASAQRMDWNAPDRVAARIVGLRRTWDDLDARIAHRTEAMFEAGVVDEVQALLTQDLSPQARNTLGLAQIVEVLEGTIDETAAKERIAQRTRRFARKQMTFFRGFDAITWIDIAPSDTVASVGEQVATLLG